MVLDEMVLDDMEIDGVWKERGERMWRPYMLFSVICFVSMFIFTLHTGRALSPYQHI